MVYVGREKPRVKIKAAVYDSETGTLGRVYSSFFAYAGVFDMYAVDGEGKKTTVGWSNVNGTDYDVIYDKSGSLYIGLPDLAELFPGSDISVKYYYIPNDYYANVFDNDGMLSENAREYTPGQISFGNQFEPAVGNKTG